MVYWEFLLFCAICHCWVMPYHILYFPVLLYPLCFWVQSSRVFIRALGAGLLSTSLITWVQQNAKTRNDAAIGIVFTVMFSLGIIGISWLNNTQNVHLDLKDFYLEMSGGFSF